MRVRYPDVDKALHQLERHGSGTPDDRAQAPQPVKFGYSCAEAAEGLRRFGVFLNGHKN